MTQAGFAKTLRQLQSQGILQAHNIISEGGYNVAVIQVPQDVPERVDDGGDVVDMLGVDTVIVTGGNSEGPVNDYAYKGQLMQPVRARFFEGLGKLGSIGASMAKRVFTEGGAPLLYAMTISANYDPLVRISDCDIANAVGAIGSAMYLAVQGGANRILLGTGLFGEDQLISSFDEARMTALGFIGASARSKVELIVLARNSQDMGAYTYVFKQAASGNERIFSEPFSSYGLALDWFGETLSETVESGSDAGLLATVVHELGG